MITHNRFVNEVGKFQLSMFQWVITKTTHAKHEIELKYHSKIIIH